MDTRPKREGRLPAAQSQLKPLPAQECQRRLELLCLIGRSLISLGDKLDDIVILNQQVADLLRRIVKERAL